MAVRLNQKFIIIIVAVLLVAAATVAGLAYLQLATSGARNIRAGDELMEAGQYEQAYTMYGRAVSHEPSNAEYRAKMEEALLKVRPGTSDKAESMYNAYLALLQHGAIYDRSNPEAHLRLLRELFDYARFANEPGLWQNLADRADDMWRFLPESEPLRYEALLYRGVAGYRRVTVAAETELDRADADLVTYLEHNPDSDVGWAALLTGRMAYAQHLSRTNRSMKTSEMLARVEHAIADIQERGIAGPETARAMVARINFARAFLGQTFTDEEVADAVNRLATQLADSGSPMLLLGSTDLFRTLDRRQGVETAIELLDDFIADNSDAIIHRLALARLYFQINELDDARATAEPLIDMDPLPTSLASRVQPVVRGEAAALLVNVAFRRWELNPDEAGETALTRIRSARERLAGVVPQTDTHPAVLRADALIAYMQRNYNRAASQFDELRRRGGGRDPETLRIEAVTLERLGQIGLARERLIEAAQQRQGDPWLQSNIARLSMQMREFDVAREAVDAALQAAPDEPSLLAMCDAIRAELEGRPDAFDDDPVNAALREARKLVRSGDATAATTLIERTLADHPDDLRLLTALGQVALSQGNIEAARRYVDRGLAVQPEHTGLQAFRERLESDDPVDIIRRTVESQYADETDRIVMTFIGVEQTVRQWEQRADRAEQAGDDEAAASYRQRADSLRSHASQLRQQAMDAAPDDPAMLEFRFSEALREGDWSAAQTLVERAAATNADQVGGKMYAARLHLTKGEHVDAVRLLIDVTQQMRYASHAWRMLGSAYRAVGNVNDAQRAFEQAYTINPNDLLTLQEYAALLLSTGDSSFALEMIRRARDLAPQNTNVREVWLEMEAAYGSVQDAIAERRRIYERNPNNRQNAMQLARTLITTRPQRANILDDAGNPRFTARQWNAMRSDDRARQLQAAQAEWIDSADRILSTLAEQQVDADLVALQAELLRRRGRSEEAESRLRDYVAAVDESMKAEALMAMAEYHRRGGRTNDAIAVMREAVAYQRGHDRPIDVALGDLLLSERQFQDAAEHYQRALDAATSDASDVVPAEVRSLRLRLAEALGNAGQFDEAREILSRDEDGNGETMEAVLLSASIDGREAAAEAQRGNADRANTLRESQRRKINLAIDMAPSNPLPLVQLASSYFESYQRTEQRRMLDEALLALNRAESLRADFTPIRTTRAEILFATGQRDTAINELRQLLERNPGNDPVRQRLIQFQLAMGETDRAIQTAERAVEHDPTRVMWHDTVGDLAMSVGRVSRAVTAFQNAFALQQSNVRLAKLAEAMLRDTSGGRPDYDRIIRLIEESATSDGPALRTLLARAHYAQGRGDVGNTHMRAAYQSLRAGIDQGRGGAMALRPWFEVMFRAYPPSANEALDAFVRDVAGDSLGAFELDQLAEAWARAGESGMERAMALAKEAVEKAMAAPQPDPQVQAIALNRLGVLYYRTGEYSAAVEAFQSHLEVEPDNAEALNNLAFVMARHTGQPDRALAYAQRAIELQPNNANFLDTLGVIYTILDRLDDAEEALRRALELNPSFASAHLHLGQVLARGGQVSEARDRFQQALAADPTPGTRQQIEQALADLEQ